MTKKNPEEVVVLPKKPIKPTHKNPKNLIIFSAPKVGKTSNLAQLENCLIFDLEEGTSYVEGLFVKIKSIADIKKYGEQIKKEGKPYKFIAVDTVTKLEEYSITLAEEMYSKSPMGSKWFQEGKKKYGNILGLPNGAGYHWIRLAFDKLISYISTLADHIILVAHVKDVSIGKPGEEISSSDLDLTGKLKRITAANSDAIGFLYRKKNKNILSFKTKAEVACGARCDHLRNKEIILSEFDPETEKVTTHWDKIYIK